MTKNYLYIILIACIFTFISCSDDNDEENPVISVTTPTDGATFNTGAGLDFSITFSDDLALGEYTIDVEPNFEDAPIDTWEESLSGSLENQLELVEKNIIVPMDVAAGQYKIAINATDGEGKEADEAIVNVWVKNLSDIEAPSVIISEPDPSLTLNLSPGAVFTIAGNIIDNIELFQYDIQIIDNSDDSVLLDNDFDLSGTGANQNFSENIPAPVNAGIYTIVITAIDGVNNRTEATIDLNVNP